MFVAMPMKPYAAFGLKDVQVHVVHSHERFGRIVVVLRSERIEVPRMELTLKLTAPGITAVVRHEISIFQESDAAMRIGTDASTEEVVPPAQHHVELVVIVASTFRVPDTLVDVAPRHLDKQREDRMHRGLGRHLTHLTIVEAFPIECASRAAKQIRCGLQLSTCECVEPSSTENTPQIATVISAQLQIVPGSGAVVRHGKDAARPVADLHPCLD